MRRVAQRMHDIRYIRVVRRLWRILRAGGRYRRHAADQRKNPGLESHEVPRLKDAMEAIRRPAAGTLDFRSGAIGPRLTDPRSESGEQRDDWRDMFGS